MWAGGVAVHPIGLVLGALITGAFGFGLGMLLHPPLWTLSVLAIPLAVISAGLAGVKLEGSPWRVPGKWSRMGHILDSGVFGVMVGMGVATALASPALYLLLAWSVAAPSWAAVWPVFLAFGLGRALPFLTLALRAYRRGTDVGEELDEMTALTPRLGLVEAALLVSLAVLFAIS
jgi:hypothetical protein